MAENKKLFQQKPSTPSKTSDPNTLATPKYRKPISDKEDVLKARRLYWSWGVREEKGRSLPKDLSRALEEAQNLFCWNDEQRTWRGPKQTEDDDDE